MANLSNRCWNCSSRSSQEFLKIVTVNVINYIFKFLLLEKYEKSCYCWFQNPSPYIQCDSCYFQPQWWVRKNFRKSIKYLSLKDVKRTSFKKEFFNLGTASSIHLDANSVFIILKTNKNVPFEKNKYINFHQFGCRLQPMPTNNHFDSICSPRVNLTRDKIQLLNSGILIERRFQSSRYQSKRVSSAFYHTYRARISSTSPRAATWRRNCERYRLKNMSPILSLQV